MKKLCFASDNASGVHPQVLEAITRVNQGYALAYGGDDYTQRVIEKMRDAFGARAEILLTFNGTGANVVGISSIARSFEAVFCSECSHLWSDECAAPEKAFGGKLIPVPSVAGKISTAAIESTFGPDRGVHHAQPKVLSITQPTELGTVYTIAEMRVLGEFAHEHRLIFHVDGARFANAAAALNCSLAAISHEVGVDVLSFGGTKNGLLGAEAVMFFNSTLADNAGHIRKQLTQLASKMRFVAAQFDALFEDDLWLSSARRANQMAARLEDAIKDINSVELTVPRQINALFPKLPTGSVNALQAECEFYLWDESANVARWMTSFCTTEEEVDRFAELIRNCA